MRLVCKYMVFHPSRRKPELDNLNVTIHGHDVERVQQTNFLGITLHQNLSWTDIDTHILMPSTLKYRKQ
jgi:hypothetical protein